MDPTIQRLDWINIQRVAAYQTSWNLEFKDFQSPQFGSAELTKWWSQLKQASCASGEQFVSSSEQARLIKNQSLCQVVDMNLYGILSAAALQHVPSIHLRRVSDHANERAAEDFSDYTSKFDGEIGKQVARIILSLRLPKSDPEAHEEIRKLLAE